MGAEGFEPPPADFFWNRPLVMGKVCRMQQVGAPVGHQLQQTHSSSFLCNWSPRYYQAILYSLVYQPLAQFFACRRARFLRRNFFLRHFQRWLPVFFQARDPRFMVNRSPTNMPYMIASGKTHYCETKHIDVSNRFRNILNALLGGGRTRIRTRVAGLEGQSDIQLHYTSKPAQKYLFHELWGWIIAKA